MKKSSTWKEYYLKNLFGIVIFDFDNEINEGKSFFKTGQLVRIFERNGDWIRCKNVNCDKFSLGLIPINYLKILSSFTDEKNMIERDWVDQFQFLLWSTIQTWIYVLQKNRISLKDIFSVSNYIKFLIKTREYVTNKEEEKYDLIDTVSLINEVNKILKIEQISFEKDLIGIIDYNTLFHLFYTSVASIEESKKKTMSTRRDSYKSKLSLSVPSVKKIYKSHHILFNLLSVEISTLNEMRMEIYINDQASDMAISESYQISLNHTKKNTIISSISNVLFSDIKFSGKYKNIELVCKLYKKMVFKKDASDLDMNVEIPFGISTFSLENFAFKSESSITIKLPIYESSDKLCYEGNAVLTRDNVLEKSVTEGKELVYALINIKIFYTNYSSIKKMNTNLFEDSVFEVSSIENSNLEKFTQNENNIVTNLFFTLVSGNLGKIHNIKSKHFVNAIICLRDMESNYVEKAICVNKDGKQNFQDFYHLASLKDVQNPVWNETVKIVLPQQNIDEYYIGIRYTVFYEEANCIKLKKKDGITFSMIKLFDVNLGFVEDGRKATFHFTTSFRHDATKFSGTGIHEYEKGMMTIISGKDVNKDNDSKKNDDIIYSTRLISNLYTSNKHIYHIRDRLEQLPWQEIDININSLCYVDSIEIAKFRVILFKRCVQIFVNNLGKERNDRFEKLLKLMLSLFSFENQNDFKNYNENSEFQYKTTDFRFTQKFLPNVVRFIENEMKNAQSFNTVSLKSIIENSICIIRVSIQKKEYTDDSNYKISTETKSAICSYLKIISEVIKCSGVKLIVICEKVLELWSQLIVLLDKFLEHEKICQIISDLVDAIPDEIETDDKINSKICYIPYKVAEFKFIAERLKAYISESLYNLICDLIIKYFNKYIVHNSTKEIFSSTCCVFLQIYKLLPKTESQQIKNVIYVDKFEEILLNANKLLHLRIASEDCNINNCLMLNILSDTQSFDVKKRVRNELSTDLNITDQLIDFMKSFAEQTKLNKYGDDLIYKSLEIIMDVIKKISALLISKEFELQKYKLLINKFMIFLLSFEKILSNMDTNRFEYKIFTSRIIYRNLRKKCIGLLIHLSTLLESENKKVLYNHLPMILEGLIKEDSDEIIDLLSSFFIELMSNKGEKNTDIKYALSQMYIFVDNNIDETNSFIKQMDKLISKILEKLQKMDSFNKKKELISEMEKYKEMITLLQELDFPKKFDDSSFFKIIKYFEMMMYFQKYNNIPLYYNNLMRTIKENETLKCYDEAARGLMLYADSLKWEEEFELPQYFWMTPKSENLRKEELHLKAISYYEKSLNFEEALLTCNKCICFYEKSLKSFSKLSNLYLKMHEICDLIYTQCGISNSFYQISLNGPDYPKYFNNKLFIVKMGRNVSLGSAIEFVNQHIPYSTIQNTKILSKDINYVKIQSCQAKSGIEDVIDDMESSSSYIQKVSERKIKFFKLNVFSETVNTSTSQNSESSPNLTVFKSKNFVKYIFPFLIPISKVINESTKKITELDQTLQMLKKAVNDLTTIINKNDTPENLFKNAIMKLQGNLIAKVNGGLDVITEKFYNGDYFDIHVEEVSKKETLTKLLSSFMNINYETINKLNQAVLLDYSPLYNEICLSYSNTASQLSKYNINCQGLPFSPVSSIPNSVSPNTYSSSPLNQKKSYTVRVVQRDFLSATKENFSSSKEKKNWLDQFSPKK